MNDIAQIKDNFDKYIVRPLNFFGFGGFVFDRAGESSVTLRNEITDHFVEDNTTIQDQIAVLPKRITLKGYEGELADLFEGSERTDTQTLARKLTTLSAALPQLSEAAQQAQDVIQQALNDDIAVDDIELPSQEDILDIYSFVKNFAPPIGKQEQAYLYFKALRDQKILLSVQTPFEFMKNMAIETITATQPESTAFVSEFSVTLKEIRFAGTEIVPISKQGRRAVQSEGVDNRGIIAGKQSTSVLGDIVGFLGGGE